MPGIVDARGDLVDDEAFPARVPDQKHLDGEDADIVEGVGDPAGEESRLLRGLRRDAGGHRVTSRMWERCVLAQRS